MKRVKIIMGLLLIFPWLLAQQQASEEQNFNFGWKFFKGEQAGAQQYDFDDSGWRKLDLPHDWSIEGPFSSAYASGTGFLPGGIGWYRKTFIVPSSEKKRRAFLYFGAIYNNSEVWINGILLGKRPNGYISFQYDLTPYIKYGKPNVIAVRVDHSKPGDSRWYTGSGIYRDVTIMYTPAVHIARWGVSASPEEVTQAGAKLVIDVLVRNENPKISVVTVSNYLLKGPDTVNKITGKMNVNGSSSGALKGEMKIQKPELWDTGNPFLYTLVTVVNGKGFTDTRLTKVGFRNIKFDPDKGFFLNGTGMKLKGVCIHHDAGALGAAVPVKEISRRLDILKELGCNAIRTSHNPFSEDFLDLCDEKGFLVIGEAFDEWELPKKKWIEGWNKGTPGKDGYSTAFGEWHARDIQDMVLRDRNHPSIIMWSIGNEIDYPNDPYTHPVLNTEANPQTWAKYDQKLPHANRLGEVARELVKLVKEVDKTRPVTAGLASALMSNESGYSAALDVAGYNYQEFRYAPDHAKYPERILYGSENGMSLEAWNSVADNDFVMGQFLWTGIEYLGEAGQFPSRHSTSGIIDLAGNRKPEFYFRQSLWSSKPMVFIGTTVRLRDNGPVNLWSHKRVDPVWNYNEGQVVSVNVFTNCEQAELFLNGRSLGIKKMSDFQNRTISWEVPFEKGELKAIAESAGKEPAEYVLNTSGEVTKIVAECDTRSLKADKQDMGWIYVSLRDEKGNIVYSAENPVKCELSGPIRLLGMEDANARNTEDYKDNSQNVYHGKLLVYVQSLDKPGKALIRLSSPGLPEKTVEIEIVD